MLAEQIAGFVIKAKDLFRKHLINLIVIADRLNCHTWLTLSSDTVIISAKTDGVNTTNTSFFV